MPKKKIIFSTAVILVLIFSYFFQNYAHSDASSSATPSNISAKSLDELNKEALTAFQKQQSKINITGSGVVLKILKDDTDGMQHQRFILDIGDQKSLLVAHNIGIAPRISDFKKGSIVRYKGEYIYNKKGGILHWTHHDSHHRHQNGWLEVNGQRYD